MGVLRGGVTWGCYMGVLHGFQGEQRGDQPLLKEHKGGGGLLSIDRPLTAANEGGS